MTGRRRRGAAARAFTLLELLIVLGVILVLASLVLAVGSSVLRAAERAQLDAAMEVFDKAFDEWEAATGRSITFVGRVGTGTNDLLFNTPQLVDRFDVRETDVVVAAGTGLDFPPGTAGALQTICRAQGSGVYAVNLLRQAEFTRDMIATVSPTLLRTEVSSGQIWPKAIASYRPSHSSAPASPRSELVDPWGKRVAFVFPGRPFRWGVDPGLPDEDGTVRTSVELLLGSCVGRRICLVSAGPDGLFGPEASTAALRASGGADNVSLYPLLPPGGN